MTDLVGVLPGVALALPADAVTAVVAQRRRRVVRAAAGLQVAVEALERGREVSRRSLTFLIYIPLNINSPHFPPFRNQARALPGRSIHETTRARVNLLFSCSSAFVWKQILIDQSVHRRRKNNE